MPERFTVEQRSRCMSQVKNRDTGPEMLVRRALHRRGLRYRLHVRSLPGSPDLVFPRYRTALFVNGCFWHGHAGCKRAARPTSHRSFWDEKIDRNIERDRIAHERLAQLGWRVLVVWQCETRTFDARVDDIVERIRGG